MTLISLAMHAYIHAYIQEYVTMGTILQTEETLLDFAVTGKVAKKKGVRGDPAMAPLHQEL